MLLTQHSRHQADFCEVFDRLHPVIRREQIGSDGECAVVGQQQAVVGLEVLAARLWQLVGGRRRVFCNRDAAERRHDFGQHCPIEWDAGHGKPGGGRRMRVDDGAGIGPVAIHLQVHLQLR